MLLLHPITVIGYVITGYHAIGYLIFYQLVQARQPAFAYAQYIYTQLEICLCAMGEMAMRKGMGGEINWHTIVI